MKKTIISSLLAMTLTSGIIGSVSAAPTFKDLATPQSHWSYETAYWAVEKGITKGYQDNTFKPNNLITEAEFLAMLLNLFPNVSMTNLNTGRWANKFYEYAHKYELPLSEQRNKPISRGLVARLISATFGFNYNQDKAIQYLFDKNLSNGKSGKKTIEDYQADSKLTRAEAVQFLRNVYEKNSGSPKFVGLTPIEGPHAALLRKIQNTVLEKGYDIQIKAQTGDFTAIKEYPLDNGRTKTEPVFSYTKAASDDQYSYFFINKLDTEVITLTKLLLINIGVPVNDTFTSQVSTVGYNGGQSKQKYGAYTVEFTGDKATGKVTVRYKIFN